MTRSERKYRLRNTASRSNLLLLLGLAVPLLTLTSCVSNQINSIEDLPRELQVTVATSNFEKNVQIPRRGSFRIARTELGGDRAADLVEYDPLLDRIVREVMGTHQYRSNPAGSVDLLVTYGVVANKPISPDTLTLNNVGQVLPFGQKSDPYGEGALFIHIYDGANRSLIWRGSIHAKLALDVNLSDEVREIRAYHIVRQLLDKFFPGKFVG